MKRVINFLRENKMHGLAILLFSIIAISVFYPASEGYVLDMGDISSYHGSSKEIKDYKEIYGDSPLWTGTSFSGMPGYQISNSYANPYGKILTISTIIFKSPINLLFLAMLCFYILLNVLKVNRLLAIVGAVAYGMLTYNLLIIEAGHITKTYAIAYFPAVLGFFIATYNSRGNKTFFYGLLFSVFLTIELHANHLQMTYYFGFLLIAIGISYFVNSILKKSFLDFLKKTAVLIIAVMLSVLGNYSNLYFTQNFAKQTIRGERIIDSNASVDKKIDEVVDFNKTKGLDRDYIVQWSYGIEESWNLIIPTAKGDKKTVEEVFTKISTSAVSPAIKKKVQDSYYQSNGKTFGSYWGNQPFTSGPNYIGALMVFLALLYLLLVHSTIKWAFLGIIPIVFMLSWGINLGDGTIEKMWFTNLFIDYIPLYTKFRAVSTILVVINLLTPLMAILFVQKFITDKEWAKAKIKSILIITGAVVLVFLVIAINPSIVGLASINELNMFKDFVVKGDQIGIESFNLVTNLRGEIVTKFALRSLVFVLFGLGLLFGFTKVKKENLKLGLLFGFLLLIYVDFSGVNKRSFEIKKSKNGIGYERWKKVDKKKGLKSASKGDLAIYNYEASINPEINKKAKESINALITKEARITEQEKQAIMFSELNFATNYRVLNLDNPFNSSEVSYFHKTTGGYNPAKLRRYQDIIEHYLQPEINLINKGAFDKMKVYNMLNNKYYLYKGDLIYKNDFAYGNAWFVKGIKWVKTDEDEIFSIANVNVKDTAIIHAEFENTIKSRQIKHDTLATIKLVNYLPNHLIYEFKSSSDELVVFSEVYYNDGWNAYIDGKKVPYFRANYVLRGLEINKGDHTVEFKFEPEMYKLGNTIIYSAFFITLFLLVLFTYLLYFKKKND